MSKPGETTSQNNMPEFGFLSLHAEWIQKYFAFGTYKKAAAVGAARLKTHQLRHYAVDKHGTIDGRPYGGGEGMILRADALYKATQTILEKQQAEVWVTDPRAKPWTQDDAKAYWDQEKPPSVLFVCGRFMGMDERFFKLQPHRKISSGSYVLGGGELAALSVCESILRLGCKVIKAKNQQDTPEINWRPEYYTRPEEFMDMKVPGDLTSGDPKKVSAFYETLKKN